MKITLKFGLLGALVWILVKMIFFLAGSSDTTVTPSAMINMFLMLVSIALGVYFHKKAEGFKQGNALSDIKAGMTTGVPYALVVSIFLYFFYEKINPEFIDSRIAKTEIELKKVLENPKEFQQLRASNEDFEVKSKEEIYEAIMENQHSMYSAKFTAILGLLGMTVLATAYSIFITIVYRRILLRNL